MIPSDGEPITDLVRAAARGDAGSHDRLMATIYQDLLRLARARLARERTYTDLNAAALVHEAYLRFAASLPRDPASRRVFFAYAARAMRSVLIDHVRRRGTKKRGDGVADITLATGAHGAEQAHTDTQVEALHAALEQLERIDTTLHEIVQLRYFAGMTIEQVAEVLSASPATIKRRWREAMTILKHSLDRPMP